MNWKLIPHSQADTSWNLLEDTIACVLEEPRRVDMGVYISDIGSSRYRAGRRLDHAPACGAEGCVAGWMVIQVVASEQKLHLLGPDLQWAACELLPFSVRQDAINLFLGKAGYTFPYMGDVGTRSYAREVVRNIRAFMNRYEAELKNYVIDRAKLGWAAPRVGKPRRRTAKKTVRKTARKPAKKAAKAREETVVQNRDRSKTTSSKTNKSTQKNRASQPAASQPRGKGAKDPKTSAHEAVDEVEETLDTLNEAEDQEIEE